MFKKLSNFKSKLVFKITLFFIFCVFVPLLAMVVYNFINIKEENIRLNENYVKDSILNFEQNFESELNRYDSIINALVEDATVTDYAKNYADTAFRENAYEFVNDFVSGEEASFKSVKFYYFKDIGSFDGIFFSAKEVEGENWYKSFFGSEKYSQWNTKVGNPTSGSLYKIVKLFNGRNEIGIAVVELDIQSIVLTVSVELRSNAKIFAFNSKSLGFYIATDAHGKQIADTLKENNFFIRSSHDSTVYCFNADKESYAVKNIPEYSLTIGCFIEAKAGYLKDSSFAVLMVVFFVLIIIVTLFYYFIISIFRTLNKDMQKMNDCIENNFTGRLSVKRNDEIGAIEQKFNFMLDNLDALTKKNIMREQSQKQAELMALQNQMNPHFIYNMLNTFRMKLVLKGDQQTAEEIAKFGKLIRYNMNTRDNCITLDEEITHLNYYLDLQNERFTEKVIYDVQIPVGYNDVLVPKFILQPLAENSFKYGKKPSAPLRITVALESIDAHCVLLSFTDNGRGCDERTVQSLNSQFATGRYIYKTDTEISSTIGLKNINERVRLIYGEDYHISVNSEPDKFFEVVFRFPTK